MTEKQKEDKAAKKEEREKVVSVKKQEEEKTAVINKEGKEVEVADATKQEEDKVTLDKKQEEKKTSNIKKEAKEKAATAKKQEDTITSPKNNDHTITVETVVSSMEDEMKHQTQVTSECKEEFLVTEKIASERNAISITDIKNMGNSLRSGDQNVKVAAVTVTVTKDEEDEKKISASESKAEVKNDKKGMTGLEMFRQKEKKTFEKKTPPSTPTSPKPAEIDENSVSFSSDAEGHGSVAVALGETLDKCADAINEMVSELGRSSPLGKKNDDESVEDVEDNSHQKSLDDNSYVGVVSTLVQPVQPNLSQRDLDEIFDSDDTEGTNDIVEYLEDVVDKEAEISINDEISSVKSQEGISEENDADNVDSVRDSLGVVDGGATILDSVKSRPHVEEGADAESSASSIGGWHVVDEDNLETQDADTQGEDEAIALAAQLIGSTLFNSDMSRSGENLSTLSGSADSGASASVSMASSVPTNVASIASEPSLTVQQRSRWVSQLAQLKELGFDEDRCVEVLERLTAANIGVEAEEEVTVAQVVNELFK